MKQIFYRWWYHTRTGNTVNCIFELKLSVGNGIVNVEIRDSLTLALLRLIIITIAIELIWKIILCVVDTFDDERRQNNYFTCAILNFWIFYFLNI